MLLTTDISSRRPACAGDVFSLRCIWIRFDVQFGYIMAWEHCPFQQDCITRQHLLVACRDAWSCSLKGLGPAIFVQIRQAPGLMQSTGRLRVCKALQKT